MVARVRVRDRVRGWDGFAFQQLCRKVELSLIERNVAKAHDQISAFARTLEEGQRPKLELGDSVALLVDPETAGYLQQEGYDTIGSVFYAKDEELRRVYMFGPKRLKQVRAALKEHNFTTPKKTGVLTPC